MPRPEALVAVESPLARDPRVRRQIEWLLSVGYAVDSLGLGDAPEEPVRQHFRLGEAPGPSAVASVRRYAFSSRRRTFEELTLSRFPRELRQKVRDGHYDLIVLNDRHFAPWVANAKDFPPAARSRRIHLDLHEYFVEKLPITSAWSALAAPYYEWCRSQFAHSSFTSRSTVNEGIADLYAAELGVDDWAIVRNSPPYVEVEPSDVDENRIRLIHHGAARWDRGLAEMLDAVALLDTRFELTLMLLGDPDVKEEVSRRASELGDRVRLAPPVPTAGITDALRPYDLEIMFYPPRTRNLELALPNKFFEAIQARLGLVIGKSPMMANLVTKYSNGIIVDGWNPSDLAESLNSLTTEQVKSLKFASGDAARDLNAGREKEAFLTAIGADDRKATT